METIPEQGIRHADREDLREAGWQHTGPPTGPSSVLGASRGPLVPEPVRQNHREGG